ncbi:sel1 repeat family protein [Pseudidiomarina marina]|uniref:tetratricopeptide repeat protein n=1 Tax=Pseudidiomarina marina TaxID=502366 RepID=UPI003851634D
MFFSLNKSLVILGLLAAIGTILPVHADATQNVTICQQGDCGRDLAELERFARKGSGDAAAVVAMAYASGDGVEQDLEKAKEFIEQGARRRNAMAMFVLSDWHSRGFVVEQSDEKAQQWLQRAVDLGYAPAQYQRGMQLLAATDPETQQEGVQLVQAAADTNLVSAIYVIARFKQTGTLMEQDLTAAGALYAKLARTGHADAQTQLRRINQQLAQAGMSNTEEAKRLQAAEAGMERITVTADANHFRSQLGRLIDQIDASGSFDNRSVGSRIQGVGCADTGSVCAVNKPEKGQGSLRDVLSGGQGN